MGAAPGRLKVVLSEAVSDSDPESDPSEEPFSASARYDRNLLAAWMPAKAPPRAAFAFGTAPLPAGRFVTTTTSSVSAFIAFMAFMTFMAGGIVITGGEANEGDGG